MHEVARVLDTRNLGNNTVATVAPAMPYQGHLCGSAVARWLASQPLLGVQCVHPVVELSWVEGWSWLAAGPNTATFKKLIKTFKHGVRTLALEHHSQLKLKHNPNCQLQYSTTMSDIPSSTHSLTHVLKEEQDSIPNSLHQCYTRYISYSLRVCGALFC